MGTYVDSALRQNKMELKTEEGLAQQLFCWNDVWNLVFSHSKHDLEKPCNSEIIWQNIFEAAGQPELNLELLNILLVHLST